MHVSEPQTLTIDVNGFSTRVWRTGTGPKLGFLAGFGGLPRWMPFLDELAKSRTVIVPSLPGFPGGDRGHTVLDSHLDWMLAVREILEKSELAGADLAGSSVGASLAAGGRGTLARRRSAASRSSRRSACSTKRTRPPIPGRNEPMQVPGPDVRRSRDLEGDEGPARRRQLDRMADRADPRRRGRRPHLLAAGQHPDREAAAADQGARRCCCGASNDRIMPRAYAEIVRQRHHRQDRRRQIIAGAGHLAELDKPAEVAQGDPRFHR